MKICIICIFYPPYTFGGGTVFVKTLAESMSKRGHDVFIITTKPYDGSASIHSSVWTVNGVRVYGFCPTSVQNIPIYSGKVSKYSRIFTFLLNFWNPLSYYLVRKILKKEKPDLVNIHGATYLSYSVYSAVRSLNIPYISTLHDVWTFYPLNNLPYLDKIAGVKYPFLNDNYKVYDIISSIYAKINRIIIGNPNYVTFVSNAVKNIYLDYGFFNQSKKIVLPNIFEIDETESKKEKTNKKTFDIIYAGGLERKKGGHTLIKAFRKIHDKYIRLHIFGSGEYEVYFKKLAEGDKRIIFYGQMPNEELQKFYKISDIAVMPSEYFETFGRIIIESFRVGVPVIGSNVGAIPELIKEGYNGFLFEPGNDEQLKNKLEYAILHKEELKEMSINCINTAKKYSVENNIYKLEEIFKEAIKLK
ncbi:MAG: hypothetical protein BWK75_00345 [Candidatus Altiarchaeales archaeon A3]|nr:MAG: hypothetical protein BWK75_00345 [Candidatus Altiarchaeales archaeon A3]